MTPELLALTLRVIIIGVLLVSGVAKLRDRDGSAEAMIGFGVPLRLVPAASSVLPWLEIALALGLVPGVTQPWAAIAIAVLFLVFTFGVLRVVLADEELDCHCFGQLSSGPVSWFTVVRNVAFTLAAIVVWWYAQMRTSESLWDALTWQRAAGIAILAAFAAMAYAIHRLWLNQWELVERIDALQEMIPVDRVAAAQGIPFAEISAEVTAQSFGGELVPIASLKQPRQPLLLLFVSDHCRACTALLPDIAAWQQEFAGLMPVSVLARGQDAEILQKIHALALEDAVLLADDILPAALKVNGNPCAVLVDHDGVIRQKPMLGGTAIRRLVAGLREQAAG